jgi:hypothetical protein
VAIVIIACPDAEAWPIVRVGLSLRDIVLPMLLRRATNEPDRPDYLIARTLLDDREISKKLTRLN